MPTKICFKCREPKSLEEFYVHPRMADGHLNKCKECTKLDVQNRYEAKRSTISEYERVRAQRPARKKKAAQYQKIRRGRYPDKERARSMVAYHLRVGNITKKPCVHCGSTDRVQAHHEDYSRPLDVIWVCFKCHREQEHNQIVTSTF